jgi:prolyl oligopeptidase
VREITFSPAFFEADDLVVTRHFTASADGTGVPYFLVAHRDSTRPAPTLQSGYGAFLASRVPAYTRYSDVLKPGTVSPTTVSPT